MQKRHFDAWGSPIRDLMGMIAYYQGDEESLKTIRRLPPLWYVVCPDVEIIIDRADTSRVMVRKTWPGGSSIVCQNIGVRGLNALRKRFRSPDAQWRVLVADLAVTYRRRGKVIPAKWSHYWLGVSAR